MKEVRKYWNMKDKQRSNTPQRQRYEYLRNYIRKGGLNYLNKQIKKTEEKLKDLYKMQVILKLNK